MDWREWFMYTPHMEIRSLNGAGTYLASTEDVYQMFKSRLLEETTACEIPERARATPTPEGK